MFERIRRLKISRPGQLINAGKLFLAQLFKLPASAGYPYRLSIEPTNYCNARCPLCPTGANQLKRVKGFMEIPLYKKIIDEVTGKTSSIILWNYGEPFLHPGIFEMVEYAKKRGLDLIASTNGLVFYTDKQVDKLAHSNLDKLIVSLDGANERTNEMYRKNVDYKKVINGLSRLKKLKQKLNKKTPYIEIQFIVMKHNEHEISKARKIAQKLGDSFSLKTVNTSMVTGINELDWLPVNKDLIRYTYTPRGIAIPRKQNFHNCPVIWYSLVINYDGSVNPCCYDYQGEIIVGDLKKETIRDVWTGKKMKDWRASILDDRRKNKICRNCSVDSEKWIA